MKRAQFRKDSYYCLLRKGLYMSGFIEGDANDVRAYQKSTFVFLENIHLYNYTC